MADIRINALATTATTPASDDYLALDGAAQGTRKILATNIANNVTDVILGSSGPSVKSSLSARAPRQGLVFNGTGVATASMTTAKSLAFTFNATSDSDILGLGWNTGSIRTQVVSGNLKVETNSPYAAYTTPVTLGKTYHVVYVGVAGSPLLVYLNGILVITGSANLPADITANTGNLIRYGANHTDAASFVGTISNPLIYNRALSASEVVSLYEAGAPAGADYPATAAGTTLNSSAWVNNNYSTFSSANGATLSATYSGSGTQYAYAAPTFVSKYGNVIRFYYDLTLTSGQVPYVILTQIGVKSCSATANLTAGTGKYVDLVVTDGSTATTIAINNTSASSWSIANARLVPLGLLLAPDAAQAGGGLVWYDTSGNAANITLPASGVSWNVPSSSYWGGTLNLAGSTNYVKISTTGTPTSGAAALQLSFNGTNSRGIRLTNVDTGGRTYDIIAGGGGDAASFGLYDDTSGAYRLFIPSSGNLLIGTTTDGGQKLQVSGTAYVSGNLSSGARITAGNGFTATSTVPTVLAASTNLDYNSGTSKGRLFIWGPDAGTVAGFDLNLANSTNSSLITALSFDSSGNATFAGTIKSTYGSFSSQAYTIGDSAYGLYVASGNLQFKNANSGTFEFKNIAGTADCLFISPTVVAVGSGASLKLGNAYVAGAPTATGYVTIQDSNGTTYKVLVGT